uniref:SH2 domain containing 4A n=1 Tax=Rattus norvegicus TaxID=10116 RepID=A0A8I5ZXE8_RAT
MEAVTVWMSKEHSLDQHMPHPLHTLKNGKSVHWKLGADKQVWVWVMGEHHLDKPYDVLCDEILAEREHLRAAKDAELRKAQSLQFTNSLKVKSLNCDLQAVKKTEPQNVTRKAAAEEATDQGPRAIPTKKDDKAQTKDLTKKKDSEELKQTEDEKTKQIYKNWKEDSEWQASLRKSKAADEKRRSLAKQAREDYKRLSQRGRSGDGLQNPLTGPQKPKRPPLPPKPQFLQPLGSPPKSLGNQGVIRTKTSSTQEDIIRWFKEEQLPFRAGYQKNSDTIAPWFHGILTLKKANELLSTGMPGSFLIRVSEKIKGYALSYLSEEGCKHFLIDASANSYSFLGVDQLQHATLADLVEYHKEEPITSLGKELLLFPCGQQDKPPDYLELFQ